MGPSPAPGCDEPTSRCQTLPSIWTLGQDQPVIPGVAFIRYATARPPGTVGSLGPTFVPARPVRLAVKLPCCPCALRPIAIRPEGTVGRLRYSLGGDRPSQTPHQPRSPVRITDASENDGTRRVVFQRRLHPGWRPGFPGSHLSYTTRAFAQRQVGVKLHGVFLSCRGSTVSSPSLQFRRVPRRDSAQIVVPFVRVGTYPTRNFATLGPL